MCFTGKIQRTLKEIGKNKRFGTLLNSGFLVSSLGKLGWWGSVLFLARGSGQREGEATASPAGHTQCSSEVLTGQPFGPSCCQGLMAASFGVCGLNGEGLVFGARECLLCCLRPVPPHLCTGETLEKFSVPLSHISFSSEHSDLSLHLS